MRVAERMWQAGQLLGTHDHITSLRRPEPEHTDFRWGDDMLR